MIHVEWVVISRPVRFANSTVFSKAIADFHHNLGKRFSLADNVVDFVLFYHIYIFNLEDWLHTTVRVVSNLHVWVHWISLTPHIFQSVRLSQCYIKEDFPIYSCDVDSLFQLRSNENGTGNKTLSCTVIPVRAEWAQDVLQIGVFVSLSALIHWLCIKLTASFERVLQFSSKKNESMVHLEKCGRCCYGQQDRSAIFTVGVGLNHYLYFVLRGIFSCKV